MSLDPLLEAPFVIQVHALAAITGFLLGGVQFLAPKGTLPHKSLGVFWMAVMFVVAVSSIFIRPSIIPDLPFLQWFSWIHIFTLITFWALAEATIYLLRGGANLKRHARAFRGLYIGGLVIAGAFAFALPGRIMNQVLFGG